MDQRNDIITSVVALTSAFIGDKYWIYADPIGAICVWWKHYSHYNIILDFHTCFLIHY